jgi:Protein of unknown function (DUF4435)
MKRQDITYDDKLGELLMDVRHPNNAARVFVCVEGESDIRFFRKFFDLARCSVEQIPGGNVKVEACAAELARHHRLVFGIRDADFLRLGTEPYQQPHMFLTDCHDMEMGMVANDDVFASVLEQYAPLADHISHDPSAQQALRQRIMRVLEMISFVKWLNQQQNLALTLTGGFLDLLDFEGDAVDIEAWLKRVLAKSGNSNDIDPTLILQQIATLKDTSPDSYQLCNGHDFMAALAQYMRQHGWKVGLKDSELAISFRLAFTPACWQETMLHAELQAWARRNQCQIY